MSYTLPPPTPSMNSIKIKKIFSFINVLLKCIENILCKYFNYWIIVWKGLQKWSAFSTFSFKGLSEKYKLQSLLSLINMGPKMEWIMGGTQIMQQTQSKCSFSY